MASASARVAAGVDGRVTVLRRAARVRTVLSDGESRRIRFDLVTRTITLLRPGTRCHRPCRLRRDHLYERRPIHRWHAPVDVLTARVSCGPLSGDTRDREETDISAGDPGDGAAIDDEPAAAGPPADVAIDRDEAVTITWVDGHHTRLALADLRRACPCARCQQLRRSGRPVWSGDPANLRIAGAELVGGWGLGLAWSDGHATGVHEWSVLRASCPCGACR